MPFWCCSLKFHLAVISLEELHFGVYMDRFYNADVAIVDMSIQAEQSVLSYHVGVRYSLNMPKTIILLQDTEPELTRAVKVGVPHTLAC